MQRFFTGREKKRRILTQRLHRQILYCKTEKQV